MFSTSLPHVNFEESLETYTDLQMMLDFTDPFT